MALVEAGDEERLGLAVGAGNPDVALAARFPLLERERAAVGRPPESVAAPHPPQWYAPLPHDGTLTDLSRWWEQFNDPLLVELIEAAQTVSPTVAAAGSRIGDARAYRLVREHFAFLAAIVRAQEGSIVKTVGDAVMAAFADPAAGVRAALAVQARVAAFNAAHQAAATDR